MSSDNNLIALGVGSNWYESTRLLIVFPTRPVFSTPIHNQARNWTISGRGRSVFCMILMQFDVIFHKQNKLLHKINKKLRVTLTLALSLPTFVINT